MKRYGKAFKIDMYLMEIISIYMDEEAKEKIHLELAPCEPEDFLKRYIELDPEFEVLLKSKFNIEFSR